MCLTLASFRVESRWPNGFGGEMTLVLYVGVGSVCGIQRDWMGLLTKIPIVAKVAASVVFKTLLRRSISHLKPRL